MIRFSKTNRKYGCFSNFYPCSVNYANMEFLNSEAAYQAMKTVKPEERQMFVNLTGKEAKKLGGKITMRPNWDKIKYMIMVDVCYAKFSQNPELKQILLSTGDEVLIEDTTGWHDNIWGNCSCERCRNITGQNLLGKALMKVRMMLRDEVEAEFMEWYSGLLKIKEKLEKQTTDNYFELQWIESMIAVCEAHFLQ